MTICIFIVYLFFVCNLLSLFDDDAAAAAMCIQSTIYANFAIQRNTHLFLSQRGEREREALCAFFPLIPLCADLYLQCVAFGLNRR